MTPVRRRHANCERLRRGKIYYLFGRDALFEL